MRNYVCHLPVVNPPDVLYHGTYSIISHQILEQGLSSNIPCDVHLTADLSIAQRFATRRACSTNSKAVVYKIDAKRMLQDGFIFYRQFLSTFIVDIVPPQYVSQLENITC